MTIMAMVVLELKCCVPSTETAMPPMARLEKRAQRRPRMPKYLPAERTEREELGNHYHERQPEASTMAIVCVGACESSAPLRLTISHCVRLCCLCKQRSARVHMVLHSMQQGPGQHGGGLPMRSE